jgi:hypothetical protein
MHYAVHYDHRFRGFSVMEPCREMHYFGSGVIKKCLLQQILKRDRWIVPSWAHRIKQLRSVTVFLLTRVARLYPATDVDYQAVTKRLRPWVRELHPWLLTSWYKPNHELFNSVQLTSWWFKYLFCGCFKLMLQANLFFVLKFTTFQDWKRTFLA